MSNPLPIAEELWAKVPPDSQAAIATVVLAMQQQTDLLETRLNDLEARLKLNSTNSHKPPSSDLLGAKRTPPAPPTGKKRAGVRVGAIRMGWGIQSMTTREQVPQTMKQTSRGSIIFPFISSMQQGK